jgi:hypothetical protein
MKIDRLQDYYPKVEYSQTGFVEDTDIIIDF